MEINDHEIDEMVEATAECFHRLVAEVSRHLTVIGKRNELAKADIQDLHLRAKLQCIDGGEFEIRVGHDPFDPGLDQQWLFMRYELNDGSWDACGQPLTNIYDACLQASDLAVRVESAYRLGVSFQGDH
ncbi:MAG: hypothetical protein RIC12_00345 [Pirellulales bacterium]